VITDHKNYVLTLGVPVIFLNLGEIPVFSLDTVCHRSHRIMEETDARPHPGVKSHVLSAQRRARRQNQETRWVGKG
jgi:hypothetical protein